MSRRLSIAKIGLASLMMLTAFHSSLIPNSQNALASQKLPSECKTRPVVFEDDNFRGKKMVLEQGNYGVWKDYLYHFFSDEISSVCVPKGWKVILYQHHGLRGDKLEVTGANSWNDLKRQRPDGKNWGDSISSIRVIRVFID
ncbi:MAG: hypothetical protein WBA07_07860 [Rivularia sp. (in: cyanobacteria)]